MLLPLWNIGGGVKHRDKLIPYFRDTKVFYDTNHKLFNYVYDSIFGLKWNGGRVCLPSDFMAIPNLIELVGEYNRLGVGFNWSFTNTLITEEDLKDDYCNLLLEATHDSLNGVIIVSEILANYIREKYPKFRIIYSVCNGLKTIEQYTDAVEKYDIVVLHPDFNHDYKFLDKLPKKEKIEVMVNDICSFGCPYRAQHYNQLSLCAKVQSTNPIIHDMIDLDYGKYNCMAVANGYTKDQRNRLTFADIEHMLDMGFEHFKLIGREHEWDYYKETDLRPNLEQFWLRKVLKEVNQHLHI